MTVNLLAHITVLLPSLYVNASIVAPNDNTTECTAIKIHDPRLVKPITNRNVYVKRQLSPTAPFNRRWSGTVSQSLFYPNRARQLRLERLQRPQFNLVTK